MRQTLLLVYPSWGCVGQEHYPAISRWNENTLGSAQERSSLSEQGDVEYFRRRMEIHMRHFDATNNQITMILYQGDGHLDIISAVLVALADSQYQQRILHR